MPSMRGLPAAWVTKLPQGHDAVGRDGIRHRGLHGRHGHRAHGAERPPARQRPGLVNGATGGVGSIAIAALARLGYHVVALTGKERESDWLKRLGASEILLRKDLDLEKIKPLDKATLGGRRRQPRRRGAGLAGEHDEGQRRRSPPSGLAASTSAQHHGDALHPARA